jgi:hypothetical protein
MLVQPETVLQNMELQTQVLEAAALETTQLAQDEEQLEL